MNGSRTVVDVDLSFGDIWDNLDSAILLNGQANYGQFQIWGDLVYMKLKVDAEIGRFPARLESRQTLFDTAIGYQFGSNQRMDWYAYLGARYVDISNDIAFDRINLGFGKKWLYYPLDTCNFRIRLIIPRGDY